MSTSYSINRSRVSPSKSSGSGYMICFLENGLGALKTMFLFSLIVLLLCIFTQKDQMKNLNTDSAVIGHGPLKPQNDYYR